MARLGTVRGTHISAIHPGAEEMGRRAVALPTIGECGPHIHIPRPKSDEPDTPYAF